MKVQELLSSENKWTQGTGARDKDDKFVSYDSPNAVKWCLLGALYKCYFMSEVDKIESEIGKDVITFNDTYSYEEVMEVVWRLDI